VADKVNDMKAIIHARRQYLPWKSLLIMIAIILTISSTDE
jgi:hypothetical protein